MSKRMIHSDISDSDKIASLSPDALSLFCLLIPHFNAHGKLHGDPNFVKGKVCPKIKWFTIRKITNCLKEISLKTNVKWFEYNGLHYLHSLNWKEHQPGLRKFGEDDLPSYGGIARKDPYPTNLTRKEVYTRDQYKCVYCHVDLSNEPRKICLDHVIPLDQMGSNNIKNLATACKKCNQKKWAKTPKEADMPWPAGLGEAYRPPVDPPSASLLQEVEVEVDVRSMKKEERREDKDCSERTPPAPSANGHRELDSNLKKLLEECPFLSLISNGESSDFWDKVLAACEPYPMADNRWLSAKIRQWDLWFKNHPGRRSLIRGKLEGRIMGWLLKDLENFSRVRTASA